MKQIVKANTSKTVATKLTAIEKSQLTKNESIIEKGLKSFVAVGKALSEIKDDRLYRETHKTFEAYVQQRFGLGRQRAYQIIDASAVVASLPANKQEEVGESKAKELKDVPASKREEVLDKANKAAKVKGKTKATAKDIKEAKEGKIVRANFQNRKDATNAKPNKSGKKYDLKEFRDELTGLIAIYRTYGLDKGGIIAELDATVTILRAEKIVRKAS